MTFVRKLALSGALAVGLGLAYTAGTQQASPAPVDTVAPSSELQNSLADARRTIQALQAKSPKDGILTVDPSTGEFFLKNMKTPEFTLQVLKGKVTGAASAFDMSRLLHAGTQKVSPLSALQTLSQSPIELQQAAVSLPTATIQRAVTTAVHRSDVSDLKVQLLPNNHLALTGKFHSIGFEAQATLRRLDGHRIGMTLNDLHYGFVTIPGPLRAAALTMALDDAPQGSVQRVGPDSVSVDVTRFLPSNFKLELGSLSTSSGQLNVTAHGYIARVSR